MVGRRTLEEFSAPDALVVGAAQALALNPGTSRSGITITAACGLGFDRDAAARLSFLMSVPVIFGAVVLKVGKLAVDGIPDGLLAPMLVGIATSAVSGWVAVWGTLRLIRTRSFAPFVLYRIVARCRRAGDHRHRLALIRAAAAGRRCRRRQRPAPTAPRRPASPPA